MPLAERITKRHFKIWELVNNMDYEAQIRAFF